MSQDQRSCCLFLHNVPTLHITQCCSGSTLFSWKLFPPLNSFVYQGGNIWLGLCNPPTPQQTPASLRHAGQIQTLKNSAFSSFVGQCASSFVCETWSGSIGLLWAAVECWFCGWVLAFSQTVVGTGGDLQQDASSFWEMWLYGHCAG